MEGETEGECGVGRCPHGGRHLAWVRARRLRRLPESALGLLADGTRKSCEPKCILPTKPLTVAATTATGNGNWQKQLATATDNCGNCGRSMMLLLLLLLTLSRTEFFTRHFPWAATAAFSDYLHTLAHTWGTTNWLLLLPGLKVN